MSNQQRGGEGGGAYFSVTDSSALNSQVNMVIGILVFNKLVSRDGILDKKLKHRAGYDSTSLLVPFFFLHSLSLTCRNGKKRNVNIDGKVKEKCFDCP